LSSINGWPRFSISYLVEDEDGGIFPRRIDESFMISSEKAVKYFYHTIVKNHFLEPYDAYNRLQNIQYLKNIIETGELLSPHSIECVRNDDGRYKVVKKHFYAEI
jgi:hypothetical protein